jgi:hypothetical protein
MTAWIRDAAATAGLLVFMVGAFGLAGVVQAAIGSV